MKPETGNRLPPELAGQLARLIRRVRMILLTRGLLAVAAVAVGSILAIMAIDAAVVLYDAPARWAFSLAGLALTLATAWAMLVRPLTQPLTLTRMARVLETRHPDMQERISSAIELAALGGAEAERASAELIGLLTQDAATDLAGVKAKQEFSVRTVKPFLLASFSVLVVLAALFAVWPREASLLFWRALVPFREFDTLSASALKVEPGDVMLLAKSPLRLVVKAPERHGLRAEILFQRAGKKARTVERMKRLSPLGVEPVVFELLIPSVEEGFEYRVRYGNAYTRPYTLLVVTAPSVKETRVAYTYPAYTGLQATQTVGEAQAIAGVIGTRVRIEAAFDRPCTPALWINALALPAAVGESAAWEQTLGTNRTGRWALSVRDAHGFTNAPVWAAFTAVPDRPPEVVLRTPEATRLTLPPYDQLICTGEASDDFGFGELSLVVNVEKKFEEQLPLKVTRSDATHAQVEGGPDLQALFARDVRRFRMFLRVADNLPPELGGPHVRESRVIEVTLDPGARTMREQVREAVKKDLEEALRKANQQLQEAANRVAEEKWSFDKPEMTDKAVQKLEQAREATMNAEALMERAARETEKTPLEAMAKPILDVRDEKVEPAFQKLEKIPLAAAEQRKQAGDEAERALREAADKVNELMWKSLQEESRAQEEQSRLQELAQREKSLSEQARADRMDKQEMQEWANKQNEAEQKLWQSKPQLADDAFNKAMENLKQARESMQQAERAVTPEADQALRREEKAQLAAEQAASQAERAAEQALKAAEKAEDFAEARAASDALQQAAQKTEAAAQQAEQAAQKAEQAADARQAEQAAQKAEQAADARQASEQAQTVAEKKAVAEQAAQAAEAAKNAAQEAAQSAEQAQQAAAAQQAGQKEQAAQAEQKAEAQAAQAKADAQQASAQATEASRQADEKKGLEKASEAGQLATEAASFAQRAADLAAESAAKSEAAAQAQEAQREAAQKEAQGLSEQSKQVAAEAAQKAEQAVQKAKEQLDQLAREAQAAAAQQPAPQAAMENAQAAVQSAQSAAQQAEQAVQAAQQAMNEAKQAGPLDQALAERMNEAASMAQQAGELARQSGERTQAAEKADLGEARERAETQQALGEAQAAAQLAHEAANMARQTAQQAAGEMAELKQTSQEAAKAASEDAREAAQKAEQAAKQMKGLDAPELQQAAAQSGEAAKLSGEAAALAQQSLQTAQQATPATDVQAVGQAQSGEAKAKQALELARQAEKRANAPLEAAEPLQQKAAEQAKQVADAVAATLEKQEKQAAEDRALVHARMAGSKTLQRLADLSGPGGSGADRSPRVPLNQDWIRFRGDMSSEAFEEMLRKTPAEYRDLVKQYFEELSREGQPGERK